MKWVSLVFVTVSFLVGLGACLPVATPLPPLPTDTPLPSTSTPTPTIVWFPPTATFTPFPTVVMTPTVDVLPQVGEILFSDDFSDPNGWTLGKSPAGTVALGKSELTLAISQPGGYLYSLRRKTDLRDFYVEITASPSLCRGGDEYGLLLRISEALEFYRFSLTCDGQVRLDKYFNDRASSPHPLSMSGSVPPGAPSTSRIAVAVIGKEMNFFVNGDFQFSVSDPSLTNGALGVFARSNGDTVVTVNFSALEVRQAGR